MDAFVNFSDFINFPTKCLSAVGLELEEPTKVSKWDKYRKPFHNILKGSMMMTFLMVIKFIGENVDNLVLIT